MLRTSPSFAALAIVAADSAGVMSVTAEVALLVVEVPEPSVSCEVMTTCSACVSSASTPAPPMSVSLPPPPVSVLLPSLPVMTLSRLFPVPLVLSLLL
jgi:hypothetical protein